MTGARNPLSRRSFLKRTGGVVSVFTTASLIAPRFPASAETADGAVSATADDMNAAERFTIVKWNGPSNAVIQLRQLQLFGNWTQWETLSHWSDLADDGTTLPTSGLIRTNGAQALQARALSAGVTNLSIVPVAAQKSNSQ